jgi:hypothetical protein
MKADGKRFPHQWHQGGARSVCSECTDTSTRMPDRSSAASSHFAHDEGDILDVSGLYVCTPQTAGADLRPQGLHAETQEDITDVNGLYYTAKAMLPLQEEPPPLPAGWIAKELEEPPPLPCGEAAVYCEDCEMWLNGPTQWEDHKIGKKHKKNIQGAGPASATPKPKDKGIEIPKLTAALIEQSALWDDAVSTYCLSVYRRAALRSRI